MGPVQRLMRIFNRNIAASDEKNQKRNFGFCLNHSPLRDIQRIRFNAHFRDNPSLQLQALLYNLENYNRIEDDTIYSFLQI